MIFYFIIDERFFCHKTGFSRIVNMLAEPVNSLSYYMECLFRIGMKAPEINCKLVLIYSESYKTMTINQNLPFLHEEKGRKYSSAKYDSSENSDNS